MEGKAATKAQADLFAAKMAAHFSFLVMRKRDVFLSQWVATGFDIARTFGAKVPSGVEFLDHTSTTIGVWVLMRDGLSPDEYIEEITHEAMHVWQFTHPEKELGLEGGLAMWWLYLVEGEALARYEAHAFATQMEVRLARGKPLPDIDGLSMPLESGYNLSADNARLAREMLTIRATAIHHGRISSPVGQYAVQALREIDPELLAPKFR